MSLPHKHTVRSAAFSPDGKLLLSGADDRAVRLWDVKSGFAGLALEGHSAGIRSVAFSPDGRRVLKGHSLGVTSVAFSPNGHCLLSGGYDKTVRLWHLETGREIRVLRGHSGTVWSGGGKPGWPTRTLWSVVFSPDGKRALSGSDDTTVRVWDQDKGRVSRLLEGHSGGVNSVAFSPDGSQVLSGSDDATVRLWDLEISREFQVAEDDSGKRWNLALVRVLEDHSASVWSVAFSPDGRHGLSAAADGEFECGTSPRRKGERSQIGERPRSFIPTQRYC